MIYTVWHRGRLLGESPLDFVRCMPRLRVGFLHPSPLGEKLLPLAGGVCGATIAYGRAARKCATEEERAHIPEYADWLAAMDKSKAIHELRGPDGSIIPTRDVCVRDYGFLHELDDDAFDESFEDELADAELRHEFGGEETSASLGLDDWDAPWDSKADEEDLLWDFDESGADEPWRSDDREYDRRMSRYQLQVELIDEASIP